MAISLGFIDKVMEYDENDIKQSNNKEVLVYNDKVFKLVRINDKLNIESVDYGKKYIILAKVGEDHVAFSGGFITRSKRNSCLGILETF